MHRRAIGEHGDSFVKPEERTQLIDDLIEGEISEVDFLRLEAEFSIDRIARQEYYDRLALTVLIENEAPASTDSIVSLPRLKPRKASWLAMAAAIVGLLAVATVFLQPRPDSNETAAHIEQRASGFAVVVGQANAIWNNLPAMPDGALLPAGELKLNSGIAQLELFSGVTLIVEGEAAFEVHSPMEMTVTRGRVRALVPEPANGFRIRTAGGEIVDIGTEFAIDVSPTHSELHVLEGEVEWHPTARAMRQLKQGEALQWDREGRGADITASPAGFVGTSELRDQMTTFRNSRRENWQRFSNTLRHDPRLIAYYHMSGADSWNRRLPNGSVAGTGVVGEAAVVAAALGTDRWNNSEGALDFSPTGSRVRLNVPGDYRSLTLLCWVKINSLDRWYNSLFLTDGHELHEPHWQIMDDGRLFFSVKKNDVWNQKKGEKDKHIFYSPSFWTASLSGQWLMVATAYDVDAKKVTHYLNGEVLSSEPIPDDYLVEAVSIGNASLGNWGLPERNDPAFAVRNLNGSMSEFALFTEALSNREIKEIYTHGRP